MLIKEKFIIGNRKLDDDMTKKKNVRDSFWLSFLIKKKLTLEEGKNMTRLRIH